jgi:hypothetical protein
VDADVNASIFRVEVSGASMEELAYTGNMQGRLSLCPHPLLSVLKMEQEGSSICLQTALCHKSADQNVNTDCRENLTLLVGKGSK